MTNQFEQIAPLEHAVKPTRSVKWPYSLFFETPPTVDQRELSYKEGACSITRHRCLFGCTDIDQKHSDCCAHNAVDSTARVVNCTTENSEKHPHISYSGIGENPTVSLTFDQNLHRDAVHCALNGWRFRQALRELDGWCRNEVKHGNRSGESRLLIEGMRELIREELDEIEWLEDL